MKLTNERLNTKNSVINSEQFERIKNYIILWKRVHGQCYYEDGPCSYCSQNKAGVSKNIDVKIENNRVRLDITVRRKGWFGIYYKSYETIYQEDDGPWWSDFWVDLNISEEKILEELKRIDEEYERKLFQFSTEYIHNKYER